MNWHLLSHDGTIQRTVTAPDKVTAQRLLGPGPVVSAASYRVDKRYTPPAPPTKPQPEREKEIPRTSLRPEGYLTTKEIATRLNTKESQVRRYGEQLLTTPLMLNEDNTRRAYWSPHQVRRISRLHYTKPIIGQSPVTIAKRRLTYLEQVIRPRYLKRAAERRAQKSTRSTHPATPESQ